jgi:6-phosphofructokinase 2
MIATLTLNPSVDKAATVPNIMPEAKMRCSEPTFEPGGGGINVARAVVKLGGDSEAYYTAGGPVGQMLQDLITAEGLTHHPLPIAALTRENFTAFEVSSDREYRFTLPGPEITTTEWQAICDWFDTRDPFPRYVVASGSLPQGVPADAYAQIAEITHKHDAFFAVDTSGQPLREALASQPDFIKPNIRELGQLAGQEMTSDAQIVETAQGIIAQGVKMVLVSLGAAGAMLITAEIDGLHIPAPTVPIRSRIGAGDSTVAGMVLGLSRGWSVEKAAHFGVAAGAAAVMTPGTSLCRREDTERLFAEML